MSSPGLYWNNRVIDIAKSDFFIVAEQLLKDQGYTNIKVSSKTVAGRTTAIHAFIGIVKKKDPPSPGPGLGTNIPPTYILVFVAAGTGSSSALTSLLKAWDALKFL